MANILPLTVSSKTADITLAGSPLRVNPFANAGITAADAPVLLSLGSRGTVDADAFAARMVKAVGQGTKAEARLFINSFASVMGDLVDEYGAITVNTPFGTVQTFIAGTLANPLDQPDPAVNYPFLGVVIPEAYRRLFAKIETYVPADACPVSLKRVRDKATDSRGIFGTNPFYLEGSGMTNGGDGETLELLDAVTRDKLCDIAVDPETKSTVQFQCQLVPQTAIEAGTYLVRLTTLAGGETTLWPVELKVELVEAVPAPPEPGITGVEKETVRLEPGEKQAILGTRLTELFGEGSWLTIVFNPKGGEPDHMVTIEQAEGTLTDERYEFSLQKIIESIDADEEKPADGTEIAIEANVVASGGSLIDTVRFTAVYVAHG